MNAIENVINNIADNVPSYYEEGDYYENNLLMCGKCKTAKQCIVSLFGNLSTVPCICECKMQQIDKQKELERLIAIRSGIEKNRQESFAESDMIRFTFDVDDGNNPKITSAAKSFVRNFKQFSKEGKGILFYGTVGTGKTFYAACIANALIDNGYTALMTNFSRISNTLQGMYSGKQEYIDNLNLYNLLVIDDLGAERRSEYIQEQVFNIIDARYRAGLSLIITTNLTIEELKKPNDVMNSRIYDRVLERCFPIEVAGQSHRRKNILSEYEDTKEMLGL